MTDKPRDLPPPDTDGISFGPGLRPVKPPKTAAERRAWGRMKPPVYPERKPGFGGWLVGLLTAWRR